MRAAGPFLAGLGGPDDTVLWHCVSAGKHLLQLDVANPAGLAVALDLVRWADVVYESFTPGVLDRLGLGYDALRAVNPSVVLVSTSLMGRTGPYADFSGFGNLAAAITGFVGLTGWPDRDPAGPFTAYTDYVSPRFAALAVLAAHHRARHTGRGCHVDLSQAEASLQVLAPALLDREVNGRVAQRRGNADRVHAPVGIYPAGPDGEDRWIAVSCRSDDQWRALCELTGRTDLAGLSQQQRHARSDELDGVLAAWTAGQDPVTLTTTLQALGIAAHPVQHSPDCLADPQLLHRGHVSRVPHPLHGEVAVEGPTVRFSRTPGYPAWAGAPLGHHNAMVLGEFLGYGEDRIAELVVAGAIR
jgi:crotonobetainyl-CoA:carnitine CoA-transferase CaiB-like acyl-CoA transferase